MQIPLSLLKLNCPHLFIHVSWGLDTNLHLMNFHVRLTLGCFLFSSWQGGSDFATHFPATKERPGSCVASAKVWSVAQTPAKQQVSVERKPDMLPDP